MTLPLFEAERPEHDRAESQWFTPPWLAKRLVDWCGTPPVNRVLEPSAGGGALVDAIRGKWPFAIVDAYETDPRWAAALREQAVWPEPTRVHESDFLASPTPSEPYDLCVMNAPYEGGQDLAFLRHAMRCSRRIVAIVRLGFVANQGTRQSVAHAGWSWVSIASLGRVRFEGDGDTSPLSDFAAIKLTSELVGRFDAPTFEWWDR
jgi:16S rRNA A1518/A1519 N6-dimethyltransferase RsmA/KsgA/DIM1 with predicted DNA glycosylase/AP lyase activity